MSDVRLLDFDGYENLVREYAEITDETPYFVVGTSAPRRDFGDLLADYAAMVGDHALLEHARGEYEHEDELDSPSMYLDRVSLESSDGVIRIGDVGFPDYGFVDDVDAQALEQAVDRTLLGASAFPESAVRPEHPAVLSTSAYLETVADLREQYDPDEYAVAVGAFAPVGNYSISNEGGVHRIGDTIFPAYAFSNRSGIASIQKAGTVFYGTTIVPREYLSEDALALIDGDVDEINAPDAGDQADDEQGASA